MADRVLLSKLPPVSEQLFKQKAAKKLTFEAIGQKLGRGEVWVASLFYGQAKPEGSDMDGLAELLDIPRELLEAEMGAAYFPDKGKLNDLPPKDPVLYRLYEIVANYGYVYKALIHEKFGDGIMSAIAFKSTGSPSPLSFVC